MTSVQKLSRIILVCREAEQLAEFYIRAFGFVRIGGLAEARSGFYRADRLCKWTGATHVVTPG